MGEQTLKARNILSISVTSSPSCLNLLDGFDFLLLNHFIKVFPSGDAAQEDCDYPLEPDSTKSLDIVLLQLCQCEVDGLKPMGPEEKVEEKVLDGFRVFDGLCPPSGEDLVVKDGTRLDEFSPGRECHQGSKGQGCDPLAALGKLILVNSDAGRFVSGHDGV